MKITRYLDVSSAEFPLCLIWYAKLRHQAKTVAQLKDFVGKLGGLQTEHQSLRLREHTSSDLICSSLDPP